MSPTFFQRFVVGFVADTNPGVEPWSGSSTRGQITQGEGDTEQKKFVKPWHWDPDIAMINSIVLRHTANKQDRK